MPKRQPSLPADLEALEKLKFRRRERLEPVMTEIHALLTMPAFQRDHQWLELLRRWLIVAYTLWPADFQGIAEHVCKRLRLGKRLAPQLIATLTNYLVLPSRGVQKVICQTETGVNLGNYDRYITDYARSKYEKADEKMLADPEVHRAVNEFRIRNPEFCKKKVLRRLMCMERNFRQQVWHFLDTPEQLAQLELDSLCYRFNLFGLEDYGTRPLLQKLSVNATPYGIIIFIPSYWSLDYSRDLNWSEINALHKAWGMLRQGPAFSEARLREIALALRVHEADEQARAEGKVSQERWDYIIKAAELPPDTDPRKIRKLLALARKLLKNEKANVDPTSMTTIQHEPLDLAPLKPISTKLEQAKAAAEGLSAAERCELMKWIGEQN